LLVRTVVHVLFVAQLRVREAIGDSRKEEEEEEVRAAMNEMAVVERECVSWRWSV